MATSNSTSTDICATEGRGASETDNICALEMQSNRRMLHFSDGVMEEPSSDSDNDGDVPDNNYAMEINERELALGPRLRYKAYKMGNNILAGIDYVGGGLASFLGITTPKYASELEHYKQAKAFAAAANEGEDLDNNWRHNSTAIGRHNNNNNNNNHREDVILCAPTPLHNAPPNRQ